MNNDATTASKTSWITVHAKAIAISIGRRLAYREDYALSLITMLLVELVGPILTALVYYNTKGFPGWNLYEVLLLQGIFLSIKGFCFAFFFGMLWNTRRLVRSGTLDLLLLKPRNPLFMLIATGFDNEDITKFIGGASLAGYAIWHLPHAEWWRYASMAGLLIPAALFFFGFAALFAAFVIRFIATIRVYELLDAFLLFGQYPRSIYSQTLSAVLTWIIPVMIVGYYPAAIILGKPMEGVWLSVIATGIFAYASYLIFTATLKHYSSAGG